MYNISKTYFPAILFLAKLLILGLASYLIYEKVWLQGEFQLLRQLAFLGSTDGLMLLCLVLLFGGANWTMEIMKWKLLVSTRRPLAFEEAARQSLASLTVSLVTPNRLGEYGAKVAYYPKSERMHVLFFNFLGNMSQLAMTILFGVIGLYAMRGLPDLELSKLGRENYLFVLLGLLMVVSVLVFPFFRRYKKWLVASNPLKGNDWAGLFGLSLLKYLAFSHQFYFMMLLFGAEPNYWVIMPTLFIVYLIASAIPGFLLFDWMVKGSVAVTLFGFAGLNELVVLSVTSLMWVMNFGIPSMIGAYHVLRFKKTSMKDVKTDTV
jgi:hypothetical protein